jgi:hypothetical protein
MHDTSDGSKTYTYKSDSSSYYTIAKQSVTLTSGSTVFDALDTALTAADISYVENTPLYQEHQRLFEGDSAKFRLDLHGNRTVNSMDCRSFTLTVSHPLMVLHR